MATNVKLYVAPMPIDAFRDAAGDLSGAVAVKEPKNGLVTLDDLTPSGPGIHLFDYLRAAGRFVPLEQH